MEIITVKNDHLSPSNPRRSREWGCVCSYCGTSFLFVDSEFLDEYDGIGHYSYVRCPHCGYTLYQDGYRSKENHFVKFNSIRDKEEFIMFHREEDE